MIDDVATDASDHLLDLMCECGHTHIEHRRGFGPCISDDHECGCSRFRLAGAGDADLGYDEDWNDQTPATDDD